MTQHSEPKSQFVTFSAIDTWMFRDGRPFNQADAGASRAVSVFPPHPPTLVGAVRAALWRASGTWNKDLLGDGTNWQDDNDTGDSLSFEGQSQLGNNTKSQDQKTRLGKLTFGPPLIMRDGKPLFPVPLHILGKKEGKKTELTWLEPGVARESDLGAAIALPTLHEPLEGAKPLSDRMVTLEGLTQIIDGKPPSADQFVKISDLWRDESRVGIGLDVNTRSVVKSELYMANHIRLNDGVSIGLEVHGAEAIAPALVPMAGEHRMAQLEVKETKGWNLPARPEINKSGRYCLIQLSSLVLDAMPKPGEQLCGFPGRVESACLGKPVPIGGWDSQNTCAIPLRLAIPAGSVWFMKLGENEAPPETKHLNTGHGVGDKWGFGHFIAAKLMESEAI